MVATNECDTNADTCCLGTNFCILQHTNRKADVYAYDTNLKPTLDIPIVSGATAYDDHMSGNTYILVFHESLYYGNKLDHSLINPNQCRSSGIGFWDNPFDKTRDIMICVNDDLNIPLILHGTKITFNSRCPTAEELETCIHVDLTSRAPWDPELVKLGECSTQPGTLSFRRLESVLSTSQYQYEDPTSDEALLHTINPPLSCLKENMLSYIKETNTMYDPDLLDVPQRKTFMWKERHNKFNAMQLAEHFMIGPKRAHATLRATTQNGTRSAILPLSRRYRLDRYFELKRLKGKFASDTLWAKTKSLQSNIAAQIYSHKNGFKALYPMKKASSDNVGDTLSEFVREFGAPEYLTFDGAAVQTGSRTQFQSIIRRSMIKYHVSGPRRPDQNPAEAAIRELKMRWYRIQSKKNIPDRLWDYGMKWVCETDNITSNSSKYCNGRTPLEIVTGETPDISEYTDFGFYDYVTFRQNAGLGQPELGRWLGVSHRVGQLMSYWILPYSGIPISCTTVQNLTNAERMTDEWKSRMSHYEEQLNNRWDAQNLDVTHKIPLEDMDNMISLENESKDFKDEYNKTISNKDIKDVEDTFDAEIGKHDPYLNMEVGLPQGESGLIHAKVKRRAVDVEGNPVGIANDNPMLDTRRYEVEYHTGETEVLSANVIAENLIAQVDEEGHRQLLIDEIEGHRTNEEAIPISRGTFITKYGTKKPVITTKGWELLVRWRDGSTNWIALKDMKQAYPVEVADYAIKCGINKEPAFAWWIPYTMKKRKAILKKIKTKYWERSHKYGIKIPHSIEEAKSIDRENGDTMWMDAIREEMRNNRKAFEEFSEDPSTLPGYQEITCHMIFDVKLSENFRRKARFVADGYKVKASSSVTYSTVVSRDSVRILLTTAAFHGLNVLGADVQNAFLEAPCLEKVWMKAGPEFGPEQGKNFIIVRALYGLRSASASFRSFMAKKFDEMGFVSSHADPDVWLRAAVTRDNFEYYEYILTYVDDLLVISENAMDIMKEIQNQVKFKKDLIEPPGNYLGARLKMKEIDDVVCWTISSHDYIQAAIKTIEEALENRPWKLPKKVTTPTSSNYAPELDMSDELNAMDTQFYQELIGILRWGTEIGRIDILFEVSIMSQHQALPREGHLQQVLHIFAFLKKNAKLTLYMDPRYPEIDYSVFRTNPDDFHEMYRDAEEKLPYLMPKPRGLEFKTTAFVDASHAANKSTRRSHTGFIIFLNRAPVMWYSKRQNTVESSAFSSEFIALKCATETIEGFRYKLRMFGIRVEGPTHIFNDNESVIKNCTKVESTLHKKHNSIAYHYVRWTVAAGIVSIAWVASEYNFADAFTKSLSAITRNRLFGAFTY